MKIFGHEFPARCYACKAKLNKHEKKREIYCPGTPELKRGIYHVCDPCYAEVVRIYNKLKREQEEAEEKARAEEEA